MANHDGNMESARELAMMDKERIKNKYQPPDVSEMAYCIFDTQLHCRYYYRTQDKYLRNVRRFSRIDTTDNRFIFINSKLV